ncbi:hypothetical protein KC19_1G032600 [Ceratodon purpureus]|uniref:S-protein homolog n=1 Tax=Ceratodon purpureus TaxID=3225 RepID=A0A8T0J494_CERPU|nr:hypothetical protein KC19_1G032600 [Ceratodon purpureus]
MKKWVFPMRITIVFLLLSISSCDRKPKISNQMEVMDFDEEDDDDEDEAMHHVKKQKIEQGVVYIENATRRPFSIVCWNQNEHDVREPRLDPKGVFVHSFARHSTDFLDCLVMSIDETAYTNILAEPISSTFRAWTYSMHHHDFHVLTRNEPDIMYGFKCNKCSWLLKERGIYHIWFDSDNNKPHEEYAFVFDWEYRGHKRSGEPLCSGRHKLRCEVEPQSLDTNFSTNTYI